MKIKEAKDLRKGDILELEVESGTECLPILSIRNEYHPIYKKNGLRLTFSNTIWSWVLPTDKIEVLND